MTNVFLLLLFFLPQQAKAAWEEKEWDMDMEESSIVNFRYIPFRRQ